MEKNTVFTGEVISLGTEGEGIIKCEGITFFVPFCCVGERVRVKALKIKGNIGYGKVEEALTLSPDRVAPRCPVFGRCGGCRLQHMSYPAQLDFKRGLVEECLRKIGGIDFPVDNTVAGESEWAYRNKLQIPVGVDENGRTVIGFYAERSHRIIPIERCAIQPVWAEKMIAALHSYMDECGLKGYDENARAGDIRHLVARQIGGKFIVALVTPRGALKGIEKFAERLSKIGEFTLSTNVNNSEGNAVFGPQFINVVGDGALEAEEGGIRYKATANTFLQVNEDVRKKLYAAAVNEVAAVGGVVVDAYSGGGLMTAMAAKICSRAYGIEIVPQATECANGLAEENGLKDRMINTCGRVEDVLPRIMQKERANEVRLILDPPRAGIDRGVLKAIMGAKLKKLVLISCNPSTLARDLGILTGALIEGENGALIKSAADGPYEIERITPFDMFPQTKHVETLVVLSHKKPDSHIEITIDFENTTLDKEAIKKRAEQRKLKDRLNRKKTQD